MSPNRKEAYYMMQDFNFDGHLRNTKNECLSPESTKSETHSKPFGRQAQKAEENEVFASPSSSSRRLTDVRGIIAPSRRDKQLMRQVSGLDLDDFDKAEAGGAEEGGLIIGGAEVGGIIAPSHRQRQLMRQVSGLGLEDPVFGKNVCLDDSIKEENANNFFADMGIDDMPEDMRDMLSLASDRTDVVETDDIQSYDSKSFASVPPLGLEPGATEEPPSTKKKLRKGKKPRRKSKDMSTTQSVTSDTMYVPPAPVFEPKSKRRGSNDAQRSTGGSVASYDRALAVDKALAAQVDAILSMNEAKSKGGSNHSRSSFTGHSRTTGVRKGTRPSKPRRQVSAASSTYVPPSVSERASQRGERCMPESFDEIFMSSSPTIKKKKKSSTGEKKKKKKTSSKILRTKDADWVVS